MYLLNLQDLCLARDFFALETFPPTLRSRTFAEKWATDSYQNILLSLIQFPAFRRNVSSEQSARLAQPWPDQLMIVSHEFKRARFMELHLPAMAVPSSAASFIGINPLFNEKQLAEVIEGDRLRGFGAWQYDLRGIGDLLRRKRHARGWDEALFIQKCISNDAAISEKAKAQLEALVTGESEMIWPTLLFES